MNLIPDWKQAHKFLSVQVNVIGTALLTTYVSLYDKVKESVPPTLMAKITIAVFVLGVIGRVVNQGIEQEKK